MLVLYQFAACRFDDNVFAHKSIQVVFFNAAKQEMISYLNFELNKNNLTACLRLPRRKEKKRKKGKKRKRYCRR